jgi:multidrug efflux system outer membrane protein
MVGRDYVRPPLVVPAAFKSAALSPEAQPIGTEWWKLYGDRELDRLIGVARAANQNVRFASGRVAEARALARIAASYLVPTITLDPTFTRQRTSGNRVSTFTGAPVTRGVSISDWLVPFDLSYEVDLWGRLRRNLESARATETAIVYDLAFVRLVVETDVALYYFTLRSLDAQGQILEKTVAAYQEQVRLVTAQLRHGLANPVALYQAQALLDATIAQARDVARARADEEHALAILCGQAAPSFSITANPLGEARPPVVPAGVPAELLSRRPDVAEAEQNLIAVNAQVGVAMADFYPRFTIGASAGVESTTASSLFDWESRIASIVPGVMQPMFTGGRIRANVEATRARYEQAKAAYVSQVLVAYGEVEDALTDVAALAAEVESLKRAVGASERYVRAAEVQYRQGLADYLVVTDAQRTLLGNELSLAQARNLQVGASIRLVKALGGGWETPGPSGGPSGGTGE